MGILKIKETNSVCSVCSFSDQDRLTAKTTGREGFPHTTQMTDFSQLPTWRELVPRGYRLVSHLCLSLLPVASPRVLYLCT